MFDAFLSSILRHGASRAEGAHLAAACRGPVTVAARTDIFDGEAPCEALVVLLEGWACKYQLLPNGRRQIVSFHLPGEICNLDSLGRARPAFSVAAIGPCAVATLPIAWLRVAIDQRPAVRDLFMAMTVAENVALTERVVSLGGLASRQRVAHFLLDLLARLEERGPIPPAGPRLPLTQQDIGDALGLSTIHVSRTFQALRERGLVAAKGRGTIIRDRAGLRALADRGGGRARKRSAATAARSEGSRSPAT